MNARGGLWRIGYRSVCLLGVGIIRHIFYIEPLVIIAFVETPRHGCAILAGSRERARHSSHPPALTGIGISNFRQWESSLAERLTTALDVQK